MTVAKDTTIEQIEARWKACQARRSTLVEEKMKISAELGTRQRTLKDRMQACTDAGFNPATIDEDIRKMKEVIVIKIENHDAELAAAEAIIAPMLSEIV